MATPTSRLARVLARRVPPEDLRAAAAAGVPTALDAMREQWAPRRRAEPDPEAGLVTLGAILKNLDDQLQDREDARRHRLRSLFAEADGVGAF